MIFAPNRTVMVLGLVALGALGFAGLQTAVLAVGGAAGAAPAPEGGALQAAATGPVDPARPFGRTGALTPREMEMARIAWSFFEGATQPDTGLANSVGNFPSTTMWDTASYLSGLVAAHELGLIDKRDFDRRATKVLATLRNLDLFRGTLPNKVYNTKTGEKVDYANKPGEVGYSALDIGRLLIWLKIIKERYPYLSGPVDNVVLRWKFCDVLDKDGRMYGAAVSKEGKVRPLQEGRLGYKEYSAKGFGLWGFDTTAASAAEPLQFERINGIDVPVDGRDPRIFHNQNYVVSEGYILEGLELNWDLPGDRSGMAGVASDGWRADFADRIYQVQERRFQDTGILTARSEHQVEGAPYFVYDAIFADGYAWNTLDPAQGYQPDRAAVSTKAAIGMWALWETDYTQILFDYVADQNEPGKGFDEGIYENGSGAIPLQSANNNGIILAALLYKAQGPILQYRNDLPQLWDTAMVGTVQRASRCLPEPQAPAPATLPASSALGNCPEGSADAALAARAYCRPAGRRRRRLALRRPGQHPGHHDIPKTL